MSQTLTLRSWIFASSPPSGSSRMNVSWTRAALPLTLNTMSPASFSIQESSPMDINFSRI
ncbi:MAG TPA: hypothetical protein VIT42_10765 [Microlunatus sp.]